MRALESGFPGLTILFTYALTVDPVAIPADWLEPRYQLLAPFVEGMLSAASDKAMLIDGYESSYIYRDESRFRQAREQMLAVAPLYGVRIEQPLRVAFGLWIDPVCGLGGLPLDGCGFSPTEFKNAVDYAIRYSDRYVWIYSQNINWYTGSGIPENWREMMLTFRQGD